MRCPLYTKTIVLIAHARPLHTICANMGVFKNPRNSREIRTLASQITPKTLELLDIYQKATRDPYSYLLINLTQDGLPQLKYMSNVFFLKNILSTYMYEKHLTLPC